ncbi:serine carboxypeptidase-like 50 [Carex littledalei]|uniref:Serine carboxypeptidase-like 50 n=1 Tax=Carex littledalei TaxID=544730 RepID=A0A833VJ28_9POAL|nr:serine carboxypeptidase-like 50 [Carex littledalei]
MAISHLFLLSLLLFSSPLPSSSTSIFPEFARPTKSGYLPIKASPSPSLFYAFYEAQEPVWPLSDTPLLLWLEGGPGASSMLANFFHFGPWLISPKDNLELRYENTAVSNRHNSIRELAVVVQIICGILLQLCTAILSHGTVVLASSSLTVLSVPVTYSIINNTNEIPRDQFTIASHLLVALQAFLSSNNLFRNRPFYITGKSYAGKFVSSLDYRILKQNQYVPSNLRINLKGIAIGNGLTHPIAQVNTHADSFYFMGLRNEEQKKYFESLQSAVVNLIITRKWKEASDLRAFILDKLQNVTGLATLFDFTRKTDYPLEIISEFLNNEEVKEAFGVSKDVQFQSISEDVINALHDDVMKSAKYMVEELVRNIKVLLYQGLYDLGDGVVSTEAWVWKDGNELIGYVQRFAGLSEVVLYDAGHFSVHDQMRHAQEMIEHWVSEKGLFYDKEEIIMKYRY